MEPVLGEQDHLEELVGLQGQDRAQFQADGLYLGRTRPPFGAVQNRKHSSGGCRGGSRALLLGSLILGSAQQTVITPAQAEVEFDKGGIIGLTVVAAQRLLSVGKPRHLVIQSETNGVEDTGFTGAGFTGDEEDSVSIKAFKIDNLLVLEWSEPGQTQSLDLHAFTSFAFCSFSSSAINAPSNSLGPTPLRTNDKKPATISGSPVAARIRSA